MRQVEDYLAKVTRLHASQPKYNEMLSDVMRPFSDIQTFLDDLPRQFDIDEAIGVQLDVVGEWVGQSRHISIPLPDIFFSFDSPNLARGFDRGIWKGPYSTANGISSLGDDTYRLLLKTIVKANVWDGTLPSAQLVLDSFFSEYPDTYVFIDDHSTVSMSSIFFKFDSPNLSEGFDEGVWYQPELDSVNRPAFDPRMTIAVSGKIPSIELISILEQQIINIKPGGVFLDVMTTSVDTLPVFGFDVDNQYIGGFDHGAWGVSAAKIVELDDQINPSPPMPPPTPAPGSSLDFRFAENSDLIVLISF